MAHPRRLRVVLLAATWVVGCGDDGGAVDVMLDAPADEAADGGGDVPDTVADGMPDGPVDGTPDEPGDAPVEAEVLPDGCSAEECNALDDDCDGLTDEDYDLDGDPLHCGVCGNVCPAADHAAPVCATGRCGYACLAGWVDVDGRTDNGCELECTPSLDPVETGCNGADDDCDGLTDEDYAPGACGFGPCTAAATCVAGVESCTPGTPAATVDELCDDSDEDCDGLVDDDYVPTRCGYGPCAADSVCVAGSASCTPGTPVVPDETTCDGIDEDCDGAVDDGPASTLCGTPGHATARCAGSCAIEACSMGWFDLNDRFADGCECQEDSKDGLGIGDLCGTAVDLGTLPDDPGAIADWAVLVGGLPNAAPAGDVDWYVFRTTDDEPARVDSNRVVVRFTTNPDGDYRFDLYRRTSTCAASCATCPSVASRIADCSAYTTDGDQTYYLRVMRVAHPESCTGYLLEVSNNRPGPLVCP